MMTIMNRGFGKMRYAAEETAAKHEANSPPGCSGKSPNNAKWSL
jgi:hypothetical protein